MNSSQKKVILRLRTIFVITLTLYIIILIQLSSIADGLRYYTLFALASTVYLFLMGFFWIRERNLYYDYVMKRRIESGNLRYLLCPNCKIIQVKGTEICTNCGSEWIICRSCLIPFENETKILVSPCCGQGFHYDHFEADLREFGSCPYCNSDLPLKTANW